MPRNLQAFFSRSVGVPPDQQARLDGLREALVLRVGESEVTWSPDPIDLHALGAGGVFYLPFLTAAFGRDSAATAELAAVLAAAERRSLTILVVPILLEDGAYPELTEVRDLRAWWASGAAVSEAAPVLDELGAWMTVRAGQFGDDQDRDWDLGDDGSASSARPEPAQVFAPHLVKKVPAGAPVLRSFVEDDELVTEHGDPRERVPAPIRPSRTYPRRRSVSPALAFVGFATFALWTGAAVWHLKPAPPPPAATMAQLAAPLAAAPTPPVEPACGNARPDPGEECDFGASNGASPGGCTAACRLPWRSVPAGTHWLGSSPTREPERADDEPWTRRVTSAAFDILPTEVTVAQRARFGAPTGEESPAAGISWRDARAFCAAVGGRLPTEAEWEAAARAHQRAPWSCGDDPTCLRGAAWYAETASQRALPVAQRAPNALGLYDMAGNVWEWVQDCYYPVAYRVAEIADAQRYATFGACNWRVVRGGSYRSGSELLRAAFRGRRKPDAADEAVGFRCVKGPAAEAYPSPAPRPT